MPGIKPFLGKDSVHGNVIVASIFCVLVLKLNSTHAKKVIDQHNKQNTNAIEAVGVFPWFAWLLRERTLGNNQPTNHLRRLMFSNWHIMYVKLCIVYVFLWPGEKLFNMLCSDNYTGRIQCEVLTTLPILSSWIKKFLGQQLKIWVDNSVEKLFR